MRDLSLLNELELKIREMVAALEREKARNAEKKVYKNYLQNYLKLKGKVKNLINLIDQLEK